MTTHDDQIDRWLREELDQELSPADAALLAAQCDPRRAAASRAEWAAFDRLLAEDRIDVAADFRDRVLCSLAEPAWADRKGLGWRIPMALAVLLAAVSSWLLAGSGAFDGALLGTGVALADFFQASLLVGAGMLASSWEGVARNLESLAASMSGVGLVALGILALALNGLLVSLLLRRRAPSSVRRE